MAEMFPNPVFEGSEKRVEIDFLLGSATSNGLRALTREQLDELMTLAHCCIVSNRSNDLFDAYVLSESSLFVYPTKWVLKTCGTTRLLQSVPRLLELAAQLGLQPLRCKYTRASFLFPEQQPFPHTSFDDETAFLDQFFGHMDAGDRQSYVLGEQFHGLQWHVYIAGRHAIDDPADHKATFNMELCMTELGEQAAKQFFRTDKFVSAAQTTKDTGIIYLKPGAIIDDYVFDPCGYSMNGIDRSGFITIHVTPEKGFSYASVEISGHLEDMVHPDSLIAAAISIFQPGAMSVAMSVDHVNADGAVGWGAVQSLPDGYMPQGATVQRLGCGGRIAYYTLGAAVDYKLPDSPTSILHHSASLLSVAAASDSDQDAA